MNSKIQEIKESNKLVIVEGKKDKISLNKLGIKNIITLSKPLYLIIEEISNNHKEAIILTDLDKQGKKLYGILRHNLQKRGVKIDNRFREFLFKNTKLSNIEGLNTYIKNKKHPFL
tara:strand:- start:55715 stop:56062 length:348 start_codon:yes stop_codon:yes gene_type:complete